MAALNSTTERLFSVYLQALLNNITFTMREEPPVKKHQRGKRKADAPPPKTFVIGRKLTQKGREIGQLSLFEKERPDGIVDGLPKEIARGATFHRLMIALAKELYLQSITEGGHYATDKSDKLKQLLGRGVAQLPSVEDSTFTANFHVIRKTIWDLGRCVWGKTPNQKQVQELYKLLGVLFKSIVEVEIEGKRWAGQLIWLQGLPADNHFDPILPWNIGLNPIFGDLFKGFSLLPIDCLERLSETAHHLSPQHLILLTLLAEQRANTYIRLFDRDFIEQLQLTNYDRNPDRKEQHIANVLDDLTQIGQIIGYEVEKRPVRGRQRWKKLTIHLNPAFGHKAGEA